MVKYLRPVTTLPLQPPACANILMAMRKLWLGAAITMSAMFFLMSWCMILQVSLAETHNALPCHTSGSDTGKHSKETPGMERCCQAGILKGNEKFKADFQPVDLVLLSGSITPSAISWHDSEFISMTPASPPTSRRLAELSLLRI